jgi:hypothetical protein
MGLILLIVLVLFLIGVFPRAGGYSEGFGYGPSGGIGLILLIVIILIVVGYVPHRF